MNSLAKQMLQYPPTPSTVIGLGLLVGLGLYELTGSVELAIMVAGVFKVLCPEDASATDTLIGAINKIPGMVPRVARAMILVPAIAALATLAACTGGAANTGVAVSQDAAAAATVSLTADEVAQLKAVCQASQPLLAAATAPAAPAPVAQTAVYPAAFCQQLASPTPPAAAKSSLAWLPAVLSGVQTAAQIAGYVLPAVLPLIAAL